MRILLYLEAVIYQSYDTDLNNANLTISNAFRIVADNSIYQRRLSTN